MNTTKSLSCTLGLHQSLHGFAWGLYPSGLYVHTAFLTPEAELLLVEDDAGAWQIPMVKLSQRHIPLHAIGIAWENVLCSNHFPELDKSTLEKARSVYDFADNAKTSFHMIVTAPVQRQVSKKYCFAKCMESLTKLVPTDSITYQAAEALGQKKFLNWARTDNVSATA